MLGGWLLWGLRRKTVIATDKVSALCSPSRNRRAGGISRCFTLLYVAMRWGGITVVWGHSGSILLKTAEENAGLVSVLQSKSPVFLRIEKGGL